MAIKPSTEELEVLNVLRDADDFEMTTVQVCSHFRGAKTSNKVINLLDALYQKGWLSKRWPSFYKVRVDQLTDGVSDKQGTP